MRTQRCLFAIEWPLEDDAPRVEREMVRYAVRAFLGMVADQQQSNGIVSGHRVQEVMQLLALRLRETLSGFIEKQ